MTDRIPLIVNPNAEQIQELPAQDKVLLSGHLEFDSNNAACGDITSTGGNDASFGLYCSTSVSNSSKVTVVGRNNAGNGNVTIADFVVGASNAPQLSIPGSTASTSKTTGALVVTGGVGIGLKLHVGDDITAFAGSDKRLKDNITPIPNAVDKVLSISGNTFNWNEKSDYEGKADTGVIAQEIEALDLPGITETRDSGYKAVRYEKLVPLLIEAIKELKAEVDELKSHSH